MPRRTEEDWEKHRFPLEKQLQSYIVTRINKYRIEHGEHIFMIKISDAYRAGISDLLLCVCGVFVAIELKTGNNKPTALQCNFLNQVTEAQGYIGVAWNWGDFKKIINPILESFHKPLL